MHVPDWKILESKYGINSKIQAAKAFIYYYLLLRLELNLTDLRELVF